jgi:hypothetical protein
VAAAEAAWRHEGATAPPTPSHASSRAGRPPTTAPKGGQAGGIRGAPEHGGEGGRNPSRRRCSAWPSEWVAAKSERWRSKSGGGVSTGAGGGERRYRSQRPAVRAAPGASGTLEREGRRGPEASVGLTDRSAGPSWSGLDQRADQAEMGWPGQMGFGLFSQLEFSLAPIKREIK